MEANLREIRRWRWLVGIPADFWLSHAEMVGKFIDEHDLQPANMHMKQVTAQAKRAIDINDLINPWGGRKLAHLHYRGELYVLNEKQWQEFTTNITREFSSKLAKAGTISFDQFIKLSDAMEPIV